MSERTLCNFCRLKWIKERAKKEGSRVYMRSSNDIDLGGVDVFVVPKGKKLDKRTGKDGNHLSGQFVAWFMELTDHCVC